VPAMVDAGLLGSWLGGAGRGSHPGPAYRRARITRLDGRTFYAVVRVDGPAGQREVDARPSDAVTLAALADLPIRVDSRLLDSLEAACMPAEWQNYSVGTAELAAESRAWMRRMREEDEKQEEAG
jgi:bifunctional DNase/RNase